MRIISGSFKGKKILEPSDAVTRPLKDLTKESIFNILTHSNKFKINIEKSVILDLFSGVGSFGIECLSRGVKKVIFVEKYVGVLPILKKNLSNLKLENNYEILEKNIYDESTFLIFKNKFDIIFLDPPYKDKNINFLIEQIIEKKILKKTGIILIHRHKKDDIEITSKLNILDTRKYGISKIIIGN